MLPRLKLLLLPGQLLLLLQLLLLRATETTMVSATLAARLPRWGRARTMAERRQRAMLRWALATSRS